ITTAPRLLTFEPDVTVQRARWRVGVSSVGWPEAVLEDRDMSLPPGRGRRCRRRRWCRRRGREVPLVASPELRAGFPDRVLERIREGRRRRRDDVRVSDHRGPL